MKEDRNARRSAWLRALPVVVVLAAAVWVSARWRAREASVVEVPSSTRIPALSAPDLFEELEAAWEAMRGTGGREQAAARLERLRLRVHGRDPSRAARHIARFLSEGKDASTSLPFEVGAGGMLASAPTLRVFLLQWLPGLDPDVAAEVAGSVMDQQRSADEYAVALRNLAWCDMGGDLRDELGKRFADMANNKKWSNTPSDGYLEALDTAVFLGGSGAFGELLRLSSSAAAGDGSPLAQACFVALDRMVEVDPGLLVAERAALAALPPVQRASLMARLDPSVEAQRDAFLAYLDDAGVGEDELGYFAELFPNGNQFRGPRLVSAERSAVAIHERAEVDRRILAWMETVLEEGGGSRRNRVLSAVRNRLASGLPEAER